MAKHGDKVEVKKAQGAEASLPSLFGGHDQLFRLREDMDRAFQNFFRGWPGLRPLDVGFPAALAKVEISPSVDISETDKAYEITVELAGLDEKDVEVTLRDDVLTISGEKKTEREEKEKDYYLSERSYGSFQRTFRLPEDVSADKIKATMEKGVMTLLLPKSPATKPKQKKISITSK